MKNKFVGLGLAVLSLALVFTACDNGVQEIDGKVGMHTAAQVDSSTIGVTPLSATYRSLVYSTGTGSWITRTRNYAVITWTGVRDGEGYSVYIQQIDNGEPKNTVINVSAYEVTNALVYSPSTFSGSAGTIGSSNGNSRLNTSRQSDSDRWTIAIPYDELPGGTSIQYRVGVSTHSYYGDNSNSSISWKPDTTITYQSWAGEF